jgi:hypothetical protein
VSRLEQEKAAFEDQVSALKQELGRLVATAARGR